MKTAWLVFKSIGSPEVFTPLDVFTGHQAYKQAKAQATQYNNGTWWNKTSQASPFFLMKIRIHVT